MTPESDSGHGCILDLCWRLEAYSKALTAGLPLTKSAREELSTVLLWLANWIRDDQVEKGFSSKLISNMKGRAP